VHLRVECMLAAATVAVAATTVLAQSAQVTIEAVSDAKGATAAVATDDGLRVEAGAVDSLGARMPRSGRLVRWRSKRGAYLVFTLRATIVHDSSTVRFELAGDGLETQGLHVALGDATDWSQPNAGRPLALVGATTVHPAVLSGDHVLFQLAMPITNRDKPHPFTARLHYLVTPNGPVPTASPAVRPVGAAKALTGVAEPMPWATPAAFGGGQ